MRQLALAVRLRERARFANYLAGPNAAAVAALRARVEHGSGAACLTGPAASGKSHLLLAAVAAAEAAGRTTSYLGLRELATSGAGSLAGQEYAQLLCCDDVDAIVGRADFERALFSIWRQAEERGAALLVAARVLPALESWAVRDLGSRLRGATERLALQPLGEEEQRAALRLRAHGLGLDMPEDVLDYLWRRLPRDLASQCQLLDELDTAALTAQRRLTVPFVREVLAARASAAAEAHGGIGDSPA